MDVAALATSFIAMQAGAMQQAVAIRMMKTSFDAEASVVQRLLQPPPSPSANLGPGVGSNLDISI